jgi:hypothetical protein
LELHHVHTRLPRMQNLAIMQYEPDYARGYGISLCVRNDFNVTARVQVALPFLGNASSLILRIAGPRPTSYEVDTFSKYKHHFTG